MMRRCRIGCSMTTRGTSTRAQIITRAQVASVLGILLIMATSQEGLFLISCSASFQRSDWLTAWPNHGGGLLNQRYAYLETKISPKSVRQLQLKWTVQTGSDVTATPCVVDNVVYVPSWNGFVYAASASTGTVLWQTNLTKVAGSLHNIPTVVCRTTPTVAGNYLLIGIYTGGYVLALDRRTGAFVWSTQLDANPYAGVTMSGTVYGGAYFVGTTSTEETQLVGCCNFQGAFFRIDVAKGKIIWRTGMIPPNGGNAGAYAGAAIWGSSPSIDPVRNLVYIATGNLYSTPPSITACQLGQQNLSVPDTPDPCILPDDHSESVLALDLDTGSIHWAQHLGSYDTWVLACVFNGNPNCPPIPGPDADFAEAPMLIPSVQFKNSSTGRQWRQDVLVVAQKSGFVYGLNPQDGSRLWTQVAGPGGSSGGAMWGSATDGQVVFTNIVNSGNQVFTLLPSRQSTTGGGWVALDAGSGEILWSTPTPDLSGPVGPVTVANGVLFTTSHSTHGKYYALDSKSGAIVWNFTPNGSVMGGFSVANGCAFVGEGNTLLGGATPGRAFYGFCL